MNTSSILSAFGMDAENCELKPLGDGLINTTWVVKDTLTNKAFVLQQVNDKVFKHPEYIANNIRLISDYLCANYPDYLFTSPVKTLDNSDLVKDAEGNYFRLFMFVEGSVTYNTLQKPAQAYEAARQFGKFTRLLPGLNISQLRTTIPDFHNIDLRFSQFIDSLKNATFIRKEIAKEAIIYLLANQTIVEEYRQIIISDNYRLRVTHHDTKISNVLFDNEDKGLCVIDLDTVMPGYFISDVGDMMRTYLSPANEEETDLTKIEVRVDFFEAIVKGYLSEMKNELSEAEKTSFVYAGKFMIYMQALRFITDYLNNDIYYKAKYEGHNLMRGQNQIELLKRFTEKEQQLSEFVSVMINDKQLIK
jgi:Ser/Thr protein kinase RdoA (MazF antagonist)